MKKYISLLVLFAICSLFVSCSKIETNNKIDNKIGDTVSTDAVEVQLTKVSYSNRYESKTVKSGYQFVIVEFSVKNVGKTNFEPFPVPSSTPFSYTYLYDPAEIVAVDYNNGYTFTISDAERSSGTVIGKNELTYNYPSLDKLSPLGEAKTYRVAICVPDEVVNNTDAPLLIKFYLVKSNGNSETVTYKIR